MRVLILARVKGTVSPTERCDLVGSGVAKHRPSKQTMFKNKLMLNANGPMGGH